MNKDNVLSHVNQLNLHFGYKSQGNYHVQINCMICKLGTFQMIKHFLDYTIDHNALK
jgi:hypothetical protein